MIATQLIGRLGGGGLMWEAAPSTGVTAPRPMLLRVNPASLATVHLTLKGQKSSLFIREPRFLALNDGDSASGLPYGRTEYAYLD